MFGVSAPENKYDYQEWIKIFNSFDLGDVGSISQQKVNDLTRLFDAFLSTFPHLHVFWAKYAQFIFSTTGSLSEALAVFDKALTEKTLMFSVEMWSELIKFISSTDATKTREAYARALDSIGWHFRSSQIWMSAIEFEISQGRNPFFYYAKALMNPIDEIVKLNRDFQTFVPKTESEKIKNYDFKMTFSSFIAQPDDVLQNEFVATEDEDRVNILKMLSSKYETSLKEVNEISAFESQITRSYFHFKTPDDAQVSVWEQYADWSVQTNKPVVYTQRIYERAVIPCEHIDGIWIQYALFLEDQGMIEEARAVYQRIPFDILHRARTYYIAFEEQYNNEEANKEAAKDANSEFAELVIFAANYYLRNNDVETAKQILAGGLERMEASEDFQGAGLLSAAFSDITKEVLKLVPQSATSIISYSTTASSEEANVAFYNAVFDESSKLLLEDKVTIAQLYLEYSRVLGVDIVFQNQLESELNNLKNRLIWHKSYFRQNCIISKIEPETVPQEWIRYQSSL